MTILYTTAQLAAASGKEPRTIREHVRRKWIAPMPKDKLPPGIKGYRFSEATAAKWLGLYAGKPLQTHSR